MKHVESNWMNRSCICTWKIFYLPVHLKWGDVTVRWPKFTLHCRESSSWRGCLRIRMRKAALGIVSFLLTWHSQLLMHEDFHIMAQIRPALMGLCKEETQYEGLKGCTRLLLRLCPWVTSGTCLFYLNTKDILSWQPCKTCMGAKNQPTTSHALYSYKGSFYSPHYNHTLFSDHYALPHSTTQLPSIWFV